MNTQDIKNYLHNMRKYVAPRRTREAPTMLNKNHDYYIKEIKEVKMEGDKVKNLTLGEELSYLKCFDEKWRPYFSLYRNGVLCNYADAGIQHIINLAIEPCGITTGSGKYAGRKLCNLTEWQQRVIISRAKHW